MKKIVLFLLFSVSSCTLSFQNVSTHGTATDLIDENQTPKTDVKTELP